MAYDNSSYRRHEPENTDSVGLPTQARYGAESGFDDTGFRSGLAASAQPAAAPTYHNGSWQAPGYAEPERTPTVPAAVLDDVFDDPGQGDAGRDRFAVHWIWEAVLLLALGGVGYLLWGADSSALTGDGLSRLLVFAAILGLLGLGAGVTLRAGAPNLAIGPVAIAAAIYFAQHGENGVAVPTMIAMLIALALGVAVALLVVVFHVPGWAASLAGGLIAIVWIQLQGTAPVPLTGAYDPTTQAALLFGAVAALSVLGGLLGTVRSVRRAVGGFRPVGDPADRRGGLPAFLTAGAIVFSMLCAVVAGVLLAAVEGRPVAPTDGFYLTGFGLGLALLGGTSAFGRRGGVFGTMLAAVLVAMFYEYQLLQDWQISRVALAAGLVVVGLMVTRLIETFGRPRPVETDEEWESGTAGGDSGAGHPGMRVVDVSGATATGSHRASAAASDWSGSTTDTWSSALPAQPAGGRNDPWDDDRWGSR